MNGDIHFYSLSDPSKKVDVVYTDRGNIEDPSKYVSVFTINGERHVNVFPSGGGHIGPRRFASDTEFLAALDIGIKI